MFLTDCVFPVLDQTLCTVNNMENAISNLTNNTYPEEADNQFTDDIYSCPPIKETTALERTGKITALVVIIATSLVGNILTIYVTQRNRNMRKIAFTFVVNMAIADLLTTLINMPETLVVEIRNTDEWFAGHVGVVLCKLLPFCQEVCAFCAILSLLAIALDRFFAICFPLKRIMTQRISKVILLFSWLIPVFASAPMIVANNVIQDEGMSYCVEEWPAPFDPDKSSNDYTIILFVLFYLFPLVVISILYICVIYKIWRRRAPGNHSSRTNQVYSRSRRKALKMFIAIVVCFALCWLPYHVTFFLMYYNEEFYNCGTPRDVYFISKYFPHAISALNPCIYIIFNRDYRNGAKRMLYSCCCRNPSMLYPQSINTGTAVNSRTEENENHEMKTFHSRSLRLGIQRIRNRKIKVSNEDVSLKGDVFLVKYNQGFLNQDEI